MRFAYFLLVATATLISSCNAVVVTSGDAQAKLSMVTSTDAGVSAQALDTINSKRFLRSYEEVKDDEDDENNEDEEATNDEDDEERGIMSSAQVRKWSGRADEWVKVGKTKGQMQEKFTGLTGAMNVKDKEKYNLFLAAYLRKHPGGY